MCLYPGMGVFAERPAENFVVLSPANPPANEAQSHGVAGLADAQVLLACFSLHPALFPFPSLSLPW